MTNRQWFSLSASGPAWVEHTPGGATRALTFNIPLDILLRCVEVPAAAERAVLMVNGNPLAETGFERAAPMERGDPPVAVRRGYFGAVVPIARQHHAAVEVRFRGDANQHPGIRLLGDLFDPARLSAPWPGLDLGITVSIPVEWVRSEFDPEVAADLGGFHVARLFAYAARPGASPRTQTQALLFSAKSLVLRHASRPLTPEAVAGDPEMEAFVDRLLAL